MPDDPVTITPMERHGDRTYARCPHCHQLAKLPDGEGLRSLEYLESIRCPHCDHRIHFKQPPQGGSGMRPYLGDD